MPSDRQKKTPAERQLDEGQKIPNPYEGEEPMTILALTTLNRDPFPTFHVLDRDVIGYRADVRGLHPNTPANVFELDEERSAFVRDTMRLWVVPSTRTIIGRPLISGTAWPEMVLRAIDRVRAGETFTPNGFAGWRRVKTSAGVDALTIVLEMTSPAEQCDRPGCRDRGEWSLVDDHFCEAEPTAGMNRFDVDVTFELTLASWAVSAERADRLTPGEASDFAVVLAEAAELADRLNRPALTATDVLAEMIATGRSAADVLADLPSVRRPLDQCAEPAVDGIGGGL